MPASGFYDFYSKIHQGQSPPPVMAAFGFYEFLGEQLIQELVKRFLKGKDELNFHRIYLDGTDDHPWEEILAQVKKSILFFNTKRLIVVVIRDEKELSLKPREKESIIEFLNQPNPHAPLFIFVSLELTRDDYKQLRKSKLEGFLKILEHKNSVLIDLDRISENQIKFFIKDYFKERGISITASAIEKIMEIKGDDFISILKELPKLELKPTKSGSIDSEDIDEIVTGINSHSIWDLTEAIEREDAATYLEILRYLFINGIKPTFIIGTLIAYYHKIYTAKFLLKHRFPVQDIGKVLQQPSFLLAKFIQMVDHFSDFKIREILNLVYRLDFDSKTGGEESARILLQKFIFQIKSISEPHSSQ